MTEAITSYAFLQLSAADLKQNFLNQCSQGSWELARAHLKTLARMNIHEAEECIKQLLEKGVPANWESTASIPSPASLLFFLALEFKGNLILLSLTS
jgi:hypothetical protein